MFLDFLWVLTTSPWVNRLVLISLFLPVLSTLILVLVPRHLSNWSVPMLMGINFLISCIILLATYQGDQVFQRCCWISVPPISFHLGIYIDTLTAVMSLVVTLLSCWVFIYSIPYLSQDVAYKRYWALLHLFVGAMLGLITFNNLGSMWILAGFILLGCACHTFELANLARMQVDAIANKPHPSLAGVCIVLGICIKSAQFPFFNWLPGAMTAPTPASALLHAATLLSAGIYVLFRIGHLLPNELLVALTFIGGISAFLGATAALTQIDFKYMLAYSTVSQLGYVVMAIGMQANFTAMVHLLTHASLKACLFLCAGAMEFSMQSNQHKKHQNYLITQMAGYAQYMPIVSIAYLLASLALVGVPGFTTAFSKEEILITGLYWAIKNASITYYLSYLIPLLSWSSSICTLIYIGKSCIAVFKGSYPWKQASPYFSEQEHLRFVPLLMQLSILFLVLCSCNLPYQLIFKFDGTQSLLHTLAHLIPDRGRIFNQTQTNIASYISIFSLLSGSFILWTTSKSPKFTISARFPRLYRLSYHGWYLGIVTKYMAQQMMLFSHFVAKIDLYVVEGSARYLAVSYVALAHVVAWIDQQLIGGMIQLVTGILAQVSSLYGNLQKGNVQRYFWWTCIGTLLIVVYWQCLL
jgi:NADH-quinone oxidoreductase subunit L